LYYYAGSTCIEEVISVFQTLQDVSIKNRFIERLKLTTWTNEKPCVSTRKFMNNLIYCNADSFTINKMYCENDTAETFQTFSFTYPENLRFYDGRHCEVFSFSNGKQTPPPKSPHSECSLYYNEYNLINIDINQLHIRGKLLPQSICNMSKPQIINYVTENYTITKTFIKNLDDDWYGRGWQKKYLNNNWQY
jgi:hypothetical protein